jgi:hypothetical protein
MTISTVDQMIAAALRPVGVRKTTGTGEAVGESWCPIFTAGNPGAASAPTGIDGAALTSLTGQITFPASVSGQYVELAGLDVQAGGGIGGIWLVDVMWWNGSVSATTTTAQSITHPGLPARDRSASAAGDGVALGILVSGATGNGSAITNMTASYTNSAGTSGRTATVTSFPATAVAGHLSVFELAAGDVGVRTVESITLGTSLISGTVHLMQYRPVAYVPITADGRGSSMAPGVLRRMWDSSVPTLIYDLVDTSIGVVSGLVSYAQG